MDNKERELPKATVPPVPEHWKDQLAMYQSFFLGLAPQTIGTAPPVSSSVPDRVITGTWYDKSYPTTPTLEEMERERLKEASSDKRRDASILVYIDALDYCFNQYHLIDADDTQEVFTKIARKKQVSKHINDIMIQLRDFIMDTNSNSNSIYTYALIDMLKYRGVLPHDYGR